MKKKLTAIFVLITISVIAGFLRFNFAKNKTGTHSCSTVIYYQGDTTFIGHNLDENYKTYGLIFINKKGISKRDISIDDFTIWGMGKPKLEWISKYGSITFNTLGKEFADGGINEAGLCVNEMSLDNTEFCNSNDKIRLYPWLWIQYVLDNFESVEQVLANLSKVVMYGDARWHFMIVDRNGNNAIIEFLKGEPIIYKNSQIPVKALCNFEYEKELSRLKDYSGFGGNKDIDFNTNCANDPRFLWAASMLNRKVNKAASEYTFDILKQLDCGGNQWSIVYDNKNMRVFFNSRDCRDIRFVDFTDFDFSKEKQILVLDIHKPLQKGNVAKEFIPFNEQINREYIGKMLDNSFKGSEFWKKIAVKRLNNYTKDFK